MSDEGVYLWVSTSDYHQLIKILERIDRERNKSRIRSSKITGEESKPKINPVKLFILNQKDDDGHYLPLSNGTPLPCNDVIGEINKNIGDTQDRQINDNLSVINHSIKNEANIQNPNQNPNQTKMSTSLRSNLIKDNNLISKDKETLEQIINELIDTNWSRIVELDTKLSREYTCEFLKRSISRWMSEFPKEKYPEILRTICDEIDYRMFIAHRYTSNSEKNKVIPEEPIPTSTQFLNYLSNPNTNIGNSEDLNNNIKLTKIKKQLFIDKDNLYKLYRNWCLINSYPEIMTSFKFERDIKWETHPWNYRASIGDERPRGFLLPDHHRLPVDVTMTTKKEILLTVKIDIASSIAEK